MDTRSSFCFIWFRFFPLLQHFICSWNISGSQGWAHSSTHSCAIPDNRRSPIPLRLPRFSERSERQAVQTVWTMFCGESAALPEQFINSTLKSFDCTEKQHDPHKLIAILLLFLAVWIDRKLCGLITKVEKNHIEVNYLINKNLNCMRHPVIKATTNKDNGRCFESLYYVLYIFGCNNSLSFFFIGWLFY